MRKPPPGYVVLEDVVDLIGGVVAGSTWRRLPDKTSPEERFNAVWSDPHVDPVITMIAEACENGRLEAAYQTAFGADELDRKMWRMPHWRNYFAAGTIDLDLPYLDDQHRPILDGRTVRCHGRELYIRKDSLERFMEPVVAAAKERAKPAASPTRRGRPSLDWEAIRKAIFELMDHHGEFSPDDPSWNAQARLEEILHDRFSAGISTLRERLPDILAAWRASKAGN
jgi:hypothetical protein